MSPHKDPQARREYIRGWYSRNKKHVREKTTLSKRARRRRARGLLAKIKHAAGCFRCGERDPICLEFHHRDPREKRFSLGNSEAADIALNDMLTEVAKCDVVCANCHRKLHAEQRTGNDIKA